MKAKGYAVQFDKLVKLTSVEAAQERIFTNFMLDSKLIADRRHVSTKSGDYSVLRELNEKWRAMARLDKRVKASFFQNRLFRIDPALGRGSVRRKGPRRSYC